MKPPQTLIICQARMESQRFPGKVLAPLGGKAMLSWVVDGLANLTARAPLVVATPNTAQNQAIVDACQAWGVPCECVDGDPNDVLSRFWQVATAYEATEIVRVTGDCPFVSAQVVDRLLALAHGERVGCDYLALAREWGDGTDCEWFTAEALYMAHADAVRPSDREHVSPYLWRHPEIFQCATMPCPLDMSSCQYSVDEPEDLVMLERILALTQPPSWRAIFGVLQTDPVLRAWQVRRQQRGQNSAYMAQIAAEQVMTTTPTWQEVRYHHG